MTIGQAIVWIVIGLLSGTLVGRVVSMSKEGLGLWRHLALGMAGAFVGGLLFHLLGILTELDSYAISLRDIVAAIVGSLIVLFAYRYASRSNVS